MSKPPRPVIATRYECTTHGPQIPVRVVIHDTECGDLAGTAEIHGIAAYWQRQGQGLGAHYIIDGDGNIGQGASPRQVTWAVRGHNTGSIHIELTGFARWTRRRWLKRAKQIRSTVHLVAYLSGEYNIELHHSTAKGLCMHRDFHGDHTDPGAGFPFPLVLRWAQKRVRRFARNGGA
jgi:N-acetyl-anhydromuramyl-L-alanine amidase AmpD